MSEDAQNRPEWAIWALGITPFVIAAFNIMSVSRGDPEVFAYLLQNLNPVALILGSILPLFPVAVVYIFIAWFVKRKSTPKSQRSVLPVYAFQLLPAVVIAAVMAMSVFWIILLTSILSIGYAFMTIENRKMKRDNSSNAGANEELLHLPTYRSATLLIIVLIGQGLVSSQSWLPSEMISVDSAAAQTGKVVASDEVWTTILGDDIRIRIVASDKVTSRQPCYSRSRTFLDQSVANAIERFWKDRQEGAVCQQ